MNFSCLKSDYEDWKNGKWKTDRVENKQRINISDHAYLTLQNDMVNFLSQNVQTDSGKIPSGFINRIFRNCRKSANSSIAYRLREKEIEYEHLLAGEKSGEKKKIISALIEDYKARLLKERERHLKGKGNSFYFRIDRENLLYLVSEEGQDEKDYYKDNISLYIKAVIEEYAELSYVERESVYHRELVDIINLAISNQKVLKLILKNEHNGKSNIKYVKVLGIYRDQEYLYNYVAGLMSDDRKGEWKPGAVRLTSVYDCDRLEQSAFISKENRDLVTALIKRQGVQYLPAGDCSCKVIVEFTSKGEKMYQKMLHLRPLYVKKVSERVYEFHCSKLQAQSYFFRFGQEAKILEPSGLAEEFLNRYQEAVKKYRQSSSQI